MGKGFLRNLFGSKKKSEGEAVATAPMQWNENPLFEAQPEASQTPFLDMLMAGEPEKAQPSKPVLKSKHKLADRHVKKRHKGKDGIAKSANEVQKIEYKRSIGDSGQNVGFFKGAQKDPKSDAASFAGIGQYDDGGKIVGDPNLGARAVASSRLDSALGLDVLSEEVFAKHKGKKGTVSAGVDGAESMTNHYSEGGALVDQTFREHDFSNPLSQKGMWDLQFMDYLTGQVDRHQGNIFVDDKSGKVTGIDNDLSFGTNNKALGEGNNYGLPQMIDKSTAAAFQGMDEEAFLATIGGKRGDFGKLGEEEKQAALERFRTMKGHVSTLEEEGGLVEEWNDETYDKATAGLYGEDGGLKKFGRWDREDNLLSRSVLTLEQQRQRNAQNVA